MSNSTTLKRLAIGLAGVAAINAIVFSPLGDEGFFAIALLGPIATGIVVGLTRGDTRLAAATWAATGLTWLVLDWIINQEDVAFHAVSRPRHGRPRRARRQPRPRRPPHRPPRPLGTGIAPIPTTTTSIALNAPS